jgi:hypothetical protein
MYMSSKERLREKEHERKRASNETLGGAVKGFGVDRLALPQFESDSFMAENAIGEEPEEGSSSKLGSALATPGPSLGAGSPGGIGSGRFIPARDSSLRKPVPTTKKRHSQRSSRSIGKQKATDDGEDTFLDLDEKVQERKRYSNRDEKSPTPEATSKMMEPLDDLEMPRPSKAKKPANATEDEDEIRVPEDEGAPAPAVAQRKSRPSPSRGDRSSSQKRRSGNATPEPLEIPPPRRNGSRLKRLSAPLSPRASSDQRNSSNLGQRVTSPEPVKPQIHVDERPSSADSIDDAVDAYLCSPRLSQKIKHPQTGRTISFSEVGDSEGFAVFCCVGMGLTRYITAFYDELALTLKLRLITPDRPGVGDSEPYNDGTATPLSWPGM